MSTLTKPRQSPPASEIALSGVITPELPENPSVDNLEISTTAFRCHPHSTCWWTGRLTCHCANCHETFTAIGTFDQHRLNGKCHDPRTMRFGSRSKYAGKLMFVDAGRAFACWKLYDEREWVGPES